MSDRCTGHCCRELYLPVSPREVAEWAAGQYMNKEGDGSDRGFWERNAIHLKTNEKGDSYFTCKQFDSVTGDCRAYDSRPNTCRNYPYDGVCGEPGCTWSEKRETGAHLLGQAITYDGTSENIERRAWIRRWFNAYPLSIGAKRITNYTRERMS